MSTYALIIILMTQNGSFMGTITDFATKKLCDEAGSSFIKDTKEIATESKYLCLVQK